MSRPGCRHTAMAGTGALGRASHARSPSFAGAETRKREKAARSAPVQGTGKKRVRQKQPHAHSSRLATLRIRKTLTLLPYKA